MLSAELSFLHISTPFTGGSSAMGLCINNYLTSKFFFLQDLLRHQLHGTMGITLSFPKLGCFIKCTCLYPFSSIKPVSYL
jgi:hypothetical protein